MTGHAGRPRRALLLSLLLAFAGASCQPLPHPFADDKPPAALLQVPDTAGVSIAPIVGVPAAAARKLGDAVAKAFLKHDIPASDRTANLDSFQLYGRVVASPPSDGRASVRALWWLYDAKGKIVGKRNAEILAAASDWQAAGNGPIEQLASLSADRLAPLLMGNMPVAAPVASETGRIRVAIDKIAGAPGDGATSLKAAIAAVLQRQNIAIAPDGKADLHIAAEVTVSPAGAENVHIKIVWHVRRPDGVDIGTVAQENDVPKGELDGDWGDIAYNVAIAASGGVIQLVARGAPPPEGAPEAANRPR
jgi:hypothetical protein